MGGFQVSIGGFRPAWVASARHGSCVVMGRGWPSVLMASRGLKKLSRMGFLGGLVLYNFVFFQNFWFNLSYVFCLVSFSLSFFFDEKV